MVMCERIHVFVWDEHTHYNAITDYKVYIYLSIYHFMYTYVLVTQTLTLSSNPVTITRAY